MQTYEGGCHCGRVRFRIRVDLEQSTVGECNCSICTKKGILHIGVTPGQFELLSGHDDLATYRFNTGIAQHAFCRHCGIPPSTFPAPIRRNSASTPAASTISIRPRCVRAAFSTGATTGKTLVPAALRKQAAASAALGHRISRYRAGQNHGALTHSLKSGRVRSRHPAEHSLAFYGAALGEGANRLITTGCCEARGARFGGLFFVTLPLSCENRDVRVSGERC